MSNIKNNVYEITSDQQLKFFFISKGTQDIVKAIQYSFVQKVNNFHIAELNGKNIYNLGFGDYDIDKDEIIDNVNTNNGDPYKVFNTVLSTIPLFFKEKSTDVLIVQGSDGTVEFLESCKKSCTKRCTNGNCKNFNRRLKIYTNYINLNYSSITSEYQIFGGKVNIKNETNLVRYVKGEQYNSILLFKKNL